MGLFDILFGTEDQSSNGFNVEDWRSVAESRRHRAQGSANWTSREDWDCGEHDDDHDDGMSGFDNYEENDF